MPHNGREQREAKRQKYLHVIFGPEVAASTAALALASVFLDGGQYAVSVGKEKLGELGETAFDFVKEHGLSPDEPVYVGFIKITFWEIVLGHRVDVNLHWQAYVAIGTRGSCKGRPTRDGRNLGNCLQANCEMIEGDYITSSDGKYRLLMQGDGNLVGYERSEPFWSSGTCGHGIPPFKLRCQDDGNAVIYDGIGNATWATGTHGTAGQFVKMQTDRNIVFYDSAKKSVWASHTVS
jgi:hypothetical protein